MKSGSALSILSELDLAYKRVKFPNTPEYALKRNVYEQCGANEIAASIVHCCRIHGFEAYRIKNSGRMVDTRKKYTNVLGQTRVAGSLRWIKGTTPNGVADIDASIVPYGGQYAASVKIEVKYLKDRQSDDQKRYEERITNSKATYFIAHSYDEFWLWFCDFIGAHTYEEHLPFVQNSRL